LRWDSTKSDGDREKGKGDSMCVDHVCIALKTKKRYIVTYLESN